jgi:predicted TPR repeat methyltransferase
MDINKQLQTAIAHHQAGALDKAERIYRAVLRKQPNNANALNLLGLVAHAGGRNDRAETLIRKALKANPQGVSFWRNLAAVLCAKDDTEGAEAAFRTVLRLAPDDFAAHNDLGNLYNGQRRLGEALDCYRRAVALQPGSALSQYNLANALYKCGEKPAALTAIRRAVALDPDQPRSQHMLRALSGEAADNAPEGYVTALFDDYAATFDQDLVERLDYRVPEQLAEALRRLRGDAPPLGRGLDLGCGTGLSGAAFRDMADWLIGIDLSANMIARAEAKGIYDELVQADIGGFLADTPDAFDLFVATDVFIYVGALDEIFRGLGRHAEPNAWFAFSTERSADEDLALRESGRFAHAPSYIAACAAASGFTMRHASETIIRSGEDGDITGDLFVLQFHG